MGSHLSNMVQLALKALLLITLGQHCIMGLNDHRGERRLDLDEESLNRYPKIDKETARRIFINTADKNGDKFLSYKEMHDEWPQMRRDKFDKYDRNNDGFLSFPEFWKLVQDHTIFTRSLEIDTESLNRYPNLDKETARMIFNRADKNGDKFLSYKEMHDKWPQMRRDKFDKYDRNNDGFLSFPEFWKLVQDHTKPTRSLEIETESLYETRILNTI